MDEFKEKSEDIVDGEILDDLDDYEDVYQYDDVYPYDDEKDYGPSNPWDAPGMKISDFITGVQYW